MTKNPQRNPKISFRPEVKRTKNMPKNQLREVKVMLKAEKIGQKKNIHSEGVNGH